MRNKLLLVFMPVLLLTLFSAGCGIGGLNGMLVPVCYIYLQKGELSQYGLENKVIEIYTIVAREENFGYDYTPECDPDTRVYGISDGRGEDREFNSMFFNPRGNFILIVGRELAPERIHEFIPKMERLLEAQNIEYEVKMRFKRRSIFAEMI